MKKLVINSFLQHVPKLKNSRIIRPLFLTSLFILLLYQLKGQPAASQLSTFEPEDSQKIQNLTPLITVQNNNTDSGSLITQKASSSSDAAPKLYFHEDFNNEGYCLMKVAEMQNREFLGEISR